MLRHQPNRPVLWLPLFLSISGLCATPLPVDAQSSTKNTRQGTSNTAKSKAKPPEGRNTKTDSHAADRAALLANVTEVAFPGVPGEIVVFGENAFAVTTAKVGNRPAALVAAAKSGRGRVVAFAHDGFFNSAEIGQTTTLLHNAATWAAGKTREQAKLVTVAVRELGTAKKQFAAEGFRVHSLDGPQWWSAIPTDSVVVLASWKEPPQATAALKAHIEQGGGVLLSGLGWAWMGYAAQPGEQLQSDAPFNRLCLPLGLAFAQASLERGEPGKGAYPISPDFAPDVHGQRIIQILEEQLADREANGQEALNAAFAVKALLENLPTPESLFPKVATLARKYRAEIPALSPQRPLKKGQDRQKALAVLNAIVAVQAPPNALTPAIGADLFPGPVAKGAARVKQEAILIDRAIPEWHSTGLYAAPGETITVQLPESARSLGLQVQIGCHADSIARHDEWKRSPFLIRREALDQTHVRVGNGFGGLIYILVPNRPVAEGTPRAVTVQIDGAVRAPYFKLGETDINDWRFTARAFPAPFGELECDRIILTVHSADLRKLDFPDKLMEQWTKVLDAYADLAGFPHERSRPERLVPDHQISAGWLHSGYPIMAQDLSVWSGKSVNFPLLQKEGEWGFYHELGHNHQVGDWTFEGTGEVTCNVFGLHALDVLNGGNRPHENAQPAWQKKREAEYIASGRKFEEWKSDPFLALIMYEQLAKGFGWDAYKTVFAEYRKLPAAERPKNEAQKRDQWMVRFSKATGKNLGPFFDHWGIPISDEAKRQVQDLPQWMPAAG